LPPMCAVAWAGVPSAPRSALRIALLSSLEGVP
jgi:hypothetical protein